MYYTRWRPIPNSESLGFFLTTQTILSTGKSAPRWAVVRCGLRAPIWPSGQHKPYTFPLSPTTTDPRGSSRPSAFVGYLPLFWALSISCIPNLLPVTTIVPQDDCLVCIFQKTTVARPQNHGEAPLTQNWYDILPFCIFNYP